MSERITDKDYRDMLRWLIAVMDAEDKRIAFIASLLAFRVKHGFLTVKQVRSFMPIHDDVATAHREGRLECQGCEVVDEDSALEEAGIEETDNVIKFKD